MLLNASQLGSVSIFSCDRQERLLTAPTLLVVVSLALPTGRSQVLSWNFWFSKVDAPEIQDQPINFVGSFRTTRTFIKNCRTLGAIMMQQDWNADRSRLRDCINSSKEDLPNHEKIGFYVHILDPDNKMTIVLSTRGLELQRPNLQSLLWTIGVLVLILICVSGDPQSTGFILVGCDSGVALFRSSLGKRIFLGQQSPQNPFGCPVFMPSTVHYAMGALRAQ